LKARFHQRRFDLASPDDPASPSPEVVAAAACETAKPAGRPASCPVSRPESEAA
jgi:hypothetical protein